MERKVNKLEHSHVEVICTVDKETWAKAQEAGFKKVASNVEIKGFRKGKAPESLVRQKVDQVKVMNEAVDSLLPTLYKAIIEEDGIKPYAQPSVNITKITADELEVKFLIVTAPEVTLGAYTGHKIGKEVVKVSDDEVEEEIKKLLAANASLVVKDGPAAEGDTVVIDFKGTVDGKAFEGGTSENYELVLGSKSFIPGFEDQLIGAKAGDHVDVKVKFPEQYTEELKGKDAVFACDVHEVKEKKLATLDEEFVKDQNIPGVNTVDELRANLASKKKAEKERDAKNKYYDALLEAIAKESKFDIPEEVIKSQADARKEDFIKQMQQSGLTLEQYLQILGQTQEQFEAQLKERATKEVTNYLIMEKVGELEKLNEVTDADLEFEMAKLADQYKMTIEQVKKALEPQLDSFRNSISMNRIETFLINNNN